MSVQVWSCGGGTQSAAIAVLIIQGRLPKPDYAVMVDTEREKSSTWRFVSGVLRPSLDAIGVDLIVIPKSRFSTEDLFAGNGQILIPAYTTQSGEVSKLSGFCSDKWKVRVKDRWLREQGIPPSRVTTWLGFSIDELRRVRAGKFRYPLIFDYPLNRNGCRELVRDVLGVVPPRSSCWMCPHMSDREWAELRDTDPKDFALACDLDTEIRERDSHAFLHRSGKPLVQIATQIGATDQIELLGCDSGYCFI